MSFCYAEICISPSEKYSCLFCLGLLFNINKDKLFYVFYSCHRHLSLSIPPPPSLSISLSLWLVSCNSAQPKKESETSHILVLQKWPHLGENMCCKYINI